MSYLIERHEKVIHAIRRIAREQIDKMVAQLDDPSADPHDTVHDVRKRCKKVRGLIRLVRPALKGSKTYQRENNWYADAARSLSFVRDSQSIIETYDSLLKRFAEHIDPSAFTPVREGLVGRRHEISHEVADLADRLQEFRRLMLQGRERSSQWKLADNGFDAVVEGLEKTYGRGCRAMKVARKESTAEHLHEWRKRTKYHWYHCRLLAGIWQQEMNARAKLGKKLSDLLGDDHDLSILSETLSADPAAFGKQTTVEALLGLIHIRRRSLQNRVLLEGERLYAEESEELSNRLEAYWNAWQREVKYAPKQLG